MEMKFAMKTLTLATAIVAAGSAQAVQTTATATVGGPAVRMFDPAGSSRSAEFSVVSGSGTLIFSNGANTYPTDPTTLGDPDALAGAVAALNTGNVALTGTGAITINESTSFSNNFNANVRNYSSAGSGVASLTAVTSDTVDSSKVGTLTLVNTLPGAAVQNVPFTSGIATGGSVNINNIRFDLSTGSVIADITGQRFSSGSGAAGKTYAPTIQPNTTLFTFNPATDIIGPSSLKPASLFAADPVAALLADGFTSVQPAGTDSFGQTLYHLTADTSFKSLQITAAGISLFQNVFGLQATGLAALRGVNTQDVDGDGILDNLAGWGTVQSRLVFQVGGISMAVIPEPGTFALMGLGLAGMSFMARRRLAAAR
jgi:PEP-CTERM motif